MKDAAFRVFIHRERLRLIRYVRSLLKDTAEMDAEDVLHDVLIKLLERPGASAPVADLSGYVYRAVKNRVTDSRRLRKQTVSLEAAEEDGSSVAALRSLDPDVVERMQTEEGKRALFDALSRLSDIERRVVVAHEFEGVSFRELSSTLGIPQNTLLSHKSRALKKLKDLMSR